MTDGGSGTGAAAAAARPPRGLSYNQVRVFMLVGGLLLLGITALLAVVAAAGVGVVLRRRADGRWGHRGPAADGRRDPGGPALQRPAAGRS